MSKYSSLSPKISLCTGYTYLILSGIILYKMGFFEESTVFSMGPPVNITGYIVETWGEYIFFMMFFSIHQGINSYISATTYPYILNDIQDRKCKEPLYSMVESLSISSLFDGYSMMDMFFLINGTYSNFLFFLGIMFTNIVVKLYINYKYIAAKGEDIEIMEVV